MSQFFRVGQFALVAATLAAPAGVNAQSTGNAGSASAPQSASDAQQSGVADIVVTAQKRSESVNSVPISISAVSGEALARKGIVDTADLTRVVPGFNFTPSTYGAPVYTLRGIGFQEVSLAASPTVSVYVDEVPLPFSSMTRGASLDLERVEVLKGPQGTLFGQNSTGGAINYIAAKPNDDWHAGGDFSYARFGKVDASAFVGGALNNAISVRASGRIEKGGDWQRSYTRDDSLGDADRMVGRLLLDLHPGERLRVAINLNGWTDKSDTQAGQLILITGNPARKPVGAANYPLGPLNSRAADWDRDAALRRDDKFRQASMRAEYDVIDAVQLTAIISLIDYDGYAANDADGNGFQQSLGIQQGAIKSFYNELRLSGTTPQLKWVVGGSYQRDRSSDNLTLLTAGSSLPFRSIISTNNQRAKAYAAFANVDYEIVSGLTAQAGMRYTDSKRDFQGCSQDTGDGTFAAIQSATATAALGRPVAIPAGGCATLGANSLPAPVENSLNEHNISWRAGLSWQVRPHLLVYANVSRGYKNGSFPTLGASRSVQFTPVTQESVLAYEMGVKASLFDRKVQFNAAAFYYDYTDKQIRGRLIDPVFGALNALVNIPKSRVRGFEAQLTWVPVKALTVSSGVSYSDSRIGGGFRNYTAFGALSSFDGEPYPLSPKWQANADVEYRVPATAEVNFVVGGGATYQSSTNAAFGQLPILDVRHYTLVDARAGIERADGALRLSAFVKNIGNTYYWTNVVTFTDSTVRYAAQPRTYGLSLSVRY